MRCNTFVTAVLILGLTPAAQAQSRRYIAPTDQTIVSVTETSQGEVPAYSIYVENHSSVRVIVSGVALRQCENVRGSCGVSGLKIKVPAGGRAFIKRVEARDQNRSFTFRYGFSWQPDSTDAEMQRVLAESGAQAGVPQSPTMPRSVSPRDVVLDQRALSELGARVAQLKLEPDSVVLKIGDYFRAGDVQIFATDSSGTILGRVWAGFNWRVRFGVVGIKSDTIIAKAPGRTEVEFTLAAPAPPLTATFPVIVIRPDSSATRFASRTANYLRPAARISDSPKFAVAH